MKVTLGPKQGHPAVMCLFLPRDFLLRRAQLYCTNNFTVVASFVPTQYTLPVTCTCRNLSALSSVCFARDFVHFRKFGEALLFRFPFLLCSGLSQFDHLRIYLLLCLLFWPGVTPKLIFHTVITAFAGLYNKVFTLCLFNPSLPDYDLHNQTGIKTLSRHLFSVSVP